MSWFTKNIDVALSSAELGDGIRHIVISRTGHLGDVALSVPFVRGVHRAFPQAEIAVVVRRPSAEIFSDCPYVSRLCFFDYKNMSAHNKMVAELREWGVDLAIALSASNLDYKLCYALKAPLRVGGVRVERFARLLTARIWLTHILQLWYKKPYRQGVPLEHEVERQARLAQFAGCGYSDLSLELPMAEKNRLYGERWRELFGGKPVLAFHLHAHWMEGGGNSRSSRWKESDLFALLRKLLQLVGAGYLLLTYGPQEEKLVEMCRHELQQVGGEQIEMLSGTQPLPSRLNGKIVLLGGLGVQQWAAVLKQTRLLVSLDTGAVHIASCMGVPVVSVHMPKKSWYSTQAFYPWNVPYSVLVKDTAEVTIPRIVEAAERLFQPSESFA